MNGKATPVDSGCSSACGLVTSVSVGGSVSNHWRSAAASGGVCSGSASRAGVMTTRSIFSVERCVETSKRRRLSISSPKNSIRTG